MINLLYYDAVVEDIKKFEEDMLNLGKPNRYWINAASGIFLISMLSFRIMYKTKFKVKDQVVYPLHGVGVIEDTYEKEGIQTDRTKYYKVKLKESGMTISVPAKNAEFMGLRKIIKKQDVSSVLKTLGVSPKNIEDDWKIRYQEHIDKLKSGTIANISTVVKELFLRNKIKNLSIMEKKQYEKAYKMLVKEIALSGNIDENEVGTLVSDKLDQLAMKLDNGENLKKANKKC